jgi:hypothetical protein
MLNYTLCDKYSNVIAEGMRNWIEASTKANDWGHSLLHAFYIVEDTETGKKYLLCSDEVEKVEELKKEIEYLKKAHKSTKQIENKLKKYEL